MKNISIFRYPGGKFRVAPLIVPIAEEISRNAIAEPFCGGASVAVLFALRNPRAKVFLNDMDERMFAFWSGLVENPGEIAREAFHYKPSVDSFYDMKNRNDAFSTLVLNRCSHSGRGGGPIGGKDQSGAWKIDARWNGSRISENMMMIGESLSGRCEVTCQDGISMIENTVKDVAFYVDTPYVTAGKSLYDKHFKQEDHERLVRALGKAFGWILSYDDHSFVRRSYDEMEGVSMKYLEVNAAKHSGGGQKQREVIYVKQ